MRIRKGFTLIELLVVIAIIGILAALAVAFLPGFGALAKEARGAQMWQSTLQIARQRAMRDRVPTGARLFIKELNDFTLPPPFHYVGTKAQYIQTPDDFTGGILGTWHPDPTVQNDFDYVFIKNIDVTEGFGLPELYAVQAGDYLEIGDSGLMHQVLAFGGQNGPPQPLPPTPWLLPPSPSYLPSVSIYGGPLGSASFLKLNTKVSFKIDGTTTYRAHRMPRLLAGEEPIEFPNQIVVDLQFNTDNAVIPNPANQNPLLPLIKIGNSTTPGAPNPNTWLYLDVVFSPRGELITTTSTTTINFFVRNLDTPYPYGGEPTVISVTTKTGIIGAFPPVPSVVPAPAAANPFALVKY
jgi:prepilin-type N-terminal cleavage/methylation domain-containing protein